MSKRIHKKCPMKYAPEKHSTRIVPAHKEDAAAGGQCRSDLRHVVEDKGQFLCLCGDKVHKVSENVDFGTLFCLARTKTPLKTAQKNVFFVQPDSPS